MTATAVPDKPVLSATVDGQDVVLSWTVPDDNGSAITTYHIQRFPSTTNDGTDVQNDWGDDLGTDVQDTDDVIIPEPMGTTTHTDRDLVPGTTYYYRIRAVNSVTTDSGQGAWSDTVQLTTMPKAPDKIADDPITIDDVDTPDVVENYEGLVLTPALDKITLSWTAPDNNGSVISEYQIQRWDSVDRMWVTIKDQLPVSVTSYEDSDVQPSTRYFYRMRAVNAGGEGPWTTLKSATTLEPTGRRIAKLRPSEVC